MKRKNGPLLAVAAAIVASSCAVIPENPGNPRELFPETVPANICYLRTVRAVKLLGFRFGFNGTGTLFEGQYLVTAAHNLYDSWRTDLVGIQVNCRARDGELATTFVSEGELQRSRKVSHYDRTFSTDYAFVKLEDVLPVVDDVVFNRAPHMEQADTIEVAGYPGGSLRYGSGKVVRPLPDDSTFYYGVDTAKGMSGGPVWGEYDGIKTLFGIHVGEGRARIVDEALIDDYEQWKASL